MTPITAVYALAVLACGLVVDGPQSPDDAFEWAELTVPPDADHVLYEGEQGIDTLVRLQFIMPNIDAARQHLATHHCTLKPLKTRRDNPFDYAHKGDPSWLVHEPQEASLSCSTEPGDGVKVYRAARVDPLPDGRVRVQVRANTV